MFLVVNRTEINKKRSFVIILAKQEPTIFITI